MVKLTVPSLIRSTSGRVYRKSEESDEQYLMRITHLYLENKQIDSIGREINYCKNLVVIYLYDNNLTEMPDLSACSVLNQLYLQNNQIKRIKHLDNLTQLTKLYLSRNQINFVEGLENCIQLQELHLEYQKFESPLDQLLFHPGSMNAISDSLLILNVAGDRINDTKSLSGLHSLVQLILSDNQLKDAEKTATELTLNSGCRKLQRIEIKNNPFCTNNVSTRNNSSNSRKYRDSFILAMPLLESIDGKDISDNSRKFLQNWKASKDAHDKKKEEMNKGDLPFPNFGSNEDFRNPVSNSNNYRSNIHSRTSGHLLRPFSIQTK